MEPLEHLYLLGLSIRGGLLRKTVAYLHSTGRTDVLVEHNRLDVVGTFLAYAIGSRQHLLFKGGAFHA